MKENTSKSFFLFLLLFLASSFKLDAQIRNYSLIASQADWVRLGFNPSYIPEGDVKTVISLPLLSSNAIDVKFPFINDKSFKVENNKMTFYTDELIRSLGGQEVVLGQDNNLLGIAWKKKQNFFSFNVALHTMSEVLMDKELTDAFARGNGAYLGKTIHSRNMIVEANLWGEVNFGFSTSLLNGKLRLGTRLKYLTGMANLQSKKNSLSLKTSEEGGQIKLAYQDEIYLNAPVQINDSQGHLDFDNMSFDTKDSKVFKPFDNYGFGIDLGADYRLNDRLNLGLAVTNLSFIKWAEKNTTIVSVNIPDDEPIVFEGVSFRDDLINAESITEKDSELGDDDEWSRIQK